MNTSAVTVFIVDDDPEVRRALARLLRASTFDVRTFGSAGEFLAEHDPSAPGCLILDIAMPDLGGLELQESLLARGCRRPIIFLTGNGDIPMSVRAIKAGAVNFLTKPVDETTLVPAVDEALRIDAAARRAGSIQDALQEKLSTLTPREREVLTHVVGGRLNKQIAADLGTVEKTIKVHRARVMRKMGVRSVAELVHMASMVGILAKPARSTPVPVVADLHRAATGPRANC